MSCTSFEPSKGFPQVVSPTFTNDSEFAKGVASTIASVCSTPSRAPPQSLEREDWDVEATARVQRALAAVMGALDARSSKAATNEGQADDEEEPLATNQNGNPARGKGRLMSEHSTSDCELSRRSPLDEAHPGSSQP